MEWTGRIETVPFLVIVFLVNVLYNHQNVNSPYMIFSNSLRIFKMSITSNQTLYLGNNYLILLIFLP